MYGSDFNLFFEINKNKKIAFIGLGISHYELIIWFLKKNMDVTVLDEIKIEQKENTSFDVELLKKLGLKFYTGQKYLTDLCRFDIIFRSPGVYFNRPEILNAISNGTIVTSEIELFLEFCPCKVIGITGSDGKTTTTTLITKMLEYDNYVVHLGGNIGKPILSKIEKIKSTDIAVIELSSFQLISVRKSPDIAVVTNISPNHLNVHKDINEYVNSKVNLVRHQNAFGVAVLNAQDRFCEKFKSESRNYVKTFSIDIPVKNGVFLDSNSGFIYSSSNSEKQKILDSKDIVIPGLHNIQNYMAAIAAVLDIVSIENIKEVATTFQGVEHRLELVRKFNNVLWYNDSIATSPTRTAAALKCFKNKKIILIAGGRDKNLDYTDISTQILKQVKILILIGENSSNIEFSIKQNYLYHDAIMPIFMAKSMSEAVNIANSHALNADVVLLSPFSSSFDMYQNFESRGESFKNIVCNLN